MYTTRHAQKLFDVKSDQTVRNWVKEFQEFFTIDATPGKGVDLQFSEEDMRVLDLIATMRSERHSSEEIYATLKSGQKGNPPAYTPEELDLLVKGDYEKHLSTQVNELNLKIEQLTRENDELKSAIQPVREQSIRLEAEKSSLEKRIEELSRELQEERKHSETIMERYLREIAELRYRMGQLEKRDNSE
jgi:chromosome segregation ATPase